MRLKTRAASGTIPSAQHSLNSGGLSFDFGDEALDPKVKSPMDSKWLKRCSFEDV